MTKIFAATAHKDGLTTTHYLEEETPFLAEKSAEKKIHADGAIFVQLMQVPPDKILEVFLKEKPGAVVTLVDVDGEVLFALQDGTGATIRPDTTSADFYALQAVSIEELATLTFRYLNSAGLWPPAAGGRIDPEQYRARPIDDGFGE